MGLEPNVAALLSYLAGWITGLVFFLLEKDNKYVRFHALQSLVVFGGLTVAWIALSVFWGVLAALRLYFLFPLLNLMNGLLSLGGLGLWIFLMIKAYQGEKIKLPVVSDIAEKNM